MQALVGEDYSLTAAFILIATLMGIDLIMTLLKLRSKMFDTITEGAPLVIVDNGRPLKNRMEKCRVDESDILEAARSSQGLEYMDEIKYAVLEKKVPYQLYRSKTINLRVRIK